MTAALSRPANATSLSSSSRLRVSHPAPEPPALIGTRPDGFVHFSGLGGALGASASAGKSIRSDHEPRGEQLAPLFRSTKARPLLAESTLRRCACRGEPHSLPSPYSWSSMSHLHASRGGRSHRFVECHRQILLNLVLRPRWPSVSWRGCCGFFTSAEPLGRREVRCGWLICFVTCHPRCFFLKIVTLPLLSRWLVAPLGTVLGYSSMSMIELASAVVSRPSMWIPSGCLRRSSVFVPARVPTFFFRFFCLLFPLAGGGGRDRG